MLQCPHCNSREFEAVETLSQRIWIRCGDDGSYVQTKEPRFLDVVEWEYLRCTDCDTELSEGDARECFEYSQQGFVFCKGCEDYAPLATAQRHPVAGWVGACCDNTIHTTKGLER